MKPDISHLLSNADELINKQDFAAAKVLLTGIINNYDNESVEAANRLSFVDIKLGNYESAADLLKQIIDAEPGNEIALKNILYLQKLLERKSQSRAGLSIIIPVFNKKELTINCLKSLTNIGRETVLEVIMVDNASSDGTGDAIGGLKKILPFEIKYLRNEYNFGFARANNIGAAEASFDTLLFLNNDTLASDNFIRQPMELLNHNGIGLVGIKLIYPDNLIQHAGLVFSKKKTASHLFKFYPSDYSPANISREMQAVTGAAIFIKKDLFERLNGFDEVYINGHEDIDLCFRVRKDGLKVWYCPDACLVHLESQSSNRFEKSIQNREIFLQRWGNNVIPDEDNYYEEIKNQISIHSFKNKFDLPEKINFAIKIGVPSRDEKNWGDIFYAGSLAAALRKQGHNCVIHYLDEWNQDDKNIHVVIHIKGLSRYALKKHNINVLWIINHPELHSPEEINSYDLVFSASEKYYRKMKDVISVPFYFMPQAADTNLFKPVTETEKEIDILFIGNNYEFKNNRCRRIIEDLKSLKREYNLKIFGDHWNGFIDPKFTAGKFVEWEMLPHYYQKAKIVLNDHQDSMRLEGFINNRTYDIAASGAFQISNYVEGMNELGIVSYNDAADLCEKIEFYLEHDEEREKVSKQNISLAESHSFENRAQEILKYLNELCKSAPAFSSCNICGYEGNDFLDMGSRKKVRCPKCDSLERQRALWFLLNRENFIKPGLKVLEIAPLNNVVFRKLFEMRGCRYVCIDKWKTGNPLDQRDTSWIDYEMDICDLKFGDEEFDLVIMQHVIEEVADDKKAFNEISRVLKKSGKAVLEIPHNIQLRNTREYFQPGKFGNVREYGVDVYQKLEEYFSYREEIKIDSICFSVLGKIPQDLQLNFPVLLDHSALDPSTFKNRFSSAIHFMNEHGYSSLTTAQVENLLYGRVNYKRPFWITLDDGKLNDITEALPVLRRTSNYATSFIIPGRLNDNEWQKWKEINGNKFLDIQSHSLFHRQVFVSPKLAGIYKGENKYSNIIPSGTPYSYPVFEFRSALSGKKFQPNNHVIEFCLEYFKKFNCINETEYVENLNRKLNEKFGSNIGTFETDDEYLVRIKYEIEESQKILAAELNKDIYAFCFPWGLYSSEALQFVKNKYSLAARVLPSVINKTFAPHEINRIEIPCSGLIQLKEKIQRSSSLSNYSIFENPKICILMTTYNRPGIIANAIQSVIDQTFKDWNLIIVNDGGEDISEVIKTFDDTRIKYFNIPHRGKSYALNFAIANSQSRYIAYLDDDDKYHPNHLEVLFNYLNNHQETEFVYSASEEVQLFNHGDAWLEKDRYVRYAFQIQPHQMRLMNHIPNLCVMHTRRLFEKAGIFDEELSVLIDWDMYRRLALVSAPVFLNQVTCEYNRKIVPGKTFAHRQMTGVYYEDLGSYYKNRLRILNKDFNIPNFKGENAVIVYLQNQTPENILAAAEKIEKAKKSIHFQPVFIVDVPLSNVLVDAIRQAEQSVILFQWNNSGINKGEFLKKFIDKNGWQKYIIFDDSKTIDVNLIQTAFEQNLRIVNFGKSFNSQFERTRVKTNPNLVSIIIPTFNKWDLTKKCLDSIYKHTPHELNYELIIVDNASTDETRKELKRYGNKFPAFKILLNDKNLGFAKANNLGAANAKGKYLLLLNNDIEVKPGWLENLRNVLDNDETVAAAGSKLLFPDNTIQHAGVVILNDKRKEINDPLVARHFRWKESADEPDTNIKRTYQALTAACLMVRKKAFEEAGGLDEGYWNGYEDIDLCFKLKAKGYKLVYQPESVLIHYESQSGAERFSRASENIKRLHNKWLGKIIPDFVIGENGNNQPSGNTAIQNYYSPVLKKKKVSIITLTYNQLEYTKKFIDSLFDFSGNNFELIVVDNASTDGTQDYLNQLQKKYVNVKVILNESNAGFPAAVNQGILEASTDYLLIANNDIVVTKNWLERMIEVMESDKSIGLVGPISNSVSGVQLDKEAVYSSIEAMHIYAQKSREKNIGKTFFFPRLAFLCPLIRKEVFEKIGGLDERFSPGNFEDDDFCLRAQLAGFKAVVAKDVFIHHYGSKSFTADGIENYSNRLETNKNIFINKWGADPEEIWLEGKTIKKRDVFYPINYNSFLQAFERLQLHAREGEYDLALAEFERAMFLYDKTAEQKIHINKSALYNIGGRLWLQINDLEKSQYYFEQALNIDPCSSDACTGLGEIFFKEGNYESAKIMFEWGQTNNPGNKFAAAGIQKCNAILSASDKSSIELPTENKFNISAQLHGVKSLIEQKQFEEAIQQLSNIESLTGETDMKLKSAIASLQGFSYLGLNKLNEARNYFERALYDEPESSDACAGLAEIFYLTGNNSEAMTMFEWALKYNAANKFANLRREQLKSSVADVN